MKESKNGSDKKRRKAALKRNRYKNAEQIGSEGNGGGQKTAFIRNLVRGSGIPALYRLYQGAEHMARDT